MTGSDPDAGGQPVTGADYLFLLFSTLCCALAWQSCVSRFRFRSLFPGGLALIIYSYISDGQEIISAWRSIFFALMGCFGGLGGSLTGNVFISKNGVGHRDHLLQSSWTESLRSWSTSGLLWGFCVKVVILDGCSIRHFLPYVTCKIA